jgi:chromosome segregation ATPase
MFDFHYVELMNWAYWPTVKLPMDQPTIMITGPNGSGKTTFLDALRVLLRAPRLSSGRRFTDYLIGDVDTAVVKAVVTNLPVDGELRPFEFKGFHSDEVTLAVIMRRKAGRWERRYIIVNGDVPLEGLRNMKRSEMLSPGQFTYEIQEAGFSDALLKVMALEQGQTDKLCEKSPRELLNLLLDVHGDKEIIERYKHARENYQAANLEVTQLGARLAEEQAKVLTAQRQAENYERYHKLELEKVRFETIVMPQAEYKAAKETIAEASLEIKDMTMQLGPLDREILSVQTALENADTELDKRKREVEKARDTRTELEGKERELDLKLNGLMQERRRYEELMDLLEDAEPEPIKPLQNKLEKARRSRIQLEMQLEDYRRRVQNLQGDISGMAQGARQKIYPAFVNDFRNLLSGKKMDYRMLCDIIEVTDPDWQLAIESILGRDRFIVLVKKGDQLAARQLGEKNRYRGYIVNADEGVAAGSEKPSSDGVALSVVRLLEDGVPKWVVDNLDRIKLVDTVKDGMKAGGQATVTRKGYRQDRRGGISIAVDRFYCGSLGQDAMRGDLEREVQSLEKEIRKIEEKLADAEADEMDLQRRIDVQESLQEGNEAKSRKEQLDEEISACNAEHKTALAVKRGAEDKLLDSLEDLNNFEHDCDKQRRWLIDKKNSQSDVLTDLKELQDSIAASEKVISDVESRLDEGLLTDKALADVQDVDELTPRLYAVEKLLEEYIEPPDSSVVAVFEHHRDQFEEQKRIYSSHEAGLRNWSDEFKQVRQKYVVVVEHTIREYRTNVLALADLAGVDAEVAMPDLSGEDALESAELNVRVGFDGKRAHDIRGATHSGGQRVISSLILLMGLATSGGRSRGGFFIIDEPFAHLSIERIADVTRFLSKTECQFILTSPTTHNVNVFSAARLQMNFRIKRPGADFAPVPTVIRR